MDTGLEYTFLHSYTNMKQVHEKMLNITGHQEMQIKTTKKYHLTPTVMALFLKGVKKKKGGKKKKVKQELAKI